MMPEITAIVRKEEKKDQQDRRQQFFGGGSQVIGNVAIHPNNTYRF